MSNQLAVDAVKTVATAGLWLFGGCQIYANTVIGDFSVPETVALWGGVLTIGFLSTYLIVTAGTASLPNGGGR